MKTWSAFYVEQGQLRRLWFEAEDEAKARSFAVRCGAGLEGESAQPHAEPAPLPEAYDEKTARRLLGGLSRTTLWKEIRTGRLDRVPNTRRVLVTRQSIERRSRG